MNYADLKPWQKPKALEKCVLSLTPDEAAKAFKEMGKVMFTARALGLACRFRGLEMVKTLVNGGAGFRFDDGQVRKSLKAAAEDADPLSYSQRFITENYFLTLIEYLNLSYMREVYGEGNSNGLKLLPLNERLLILNYLFKTADQTGFKPDVFMFFAILGDEGEMVALLKKNGVGVSEKWAEIAVNGGSQEEWYDYCIMLRTIGDDRFIPILKQLIAEIGEVSENSKLHFTELFWLLHKDKFLRPEFFKFLLESFNQSKMKKGGLMKALIDLDNASCLEIAVNNGWLKQPKKRDEMIKYAVDNEKTECAAFLLDFKNSTADLKAEQEKEENKAQRELNAAPDSVMMQKKIWNYKKGEDGGIIITGYKGKQTVIKVPEKIGKSRVTVINRMAFSPRAGRLNVKDSTFRKTITEITLPDGIVKICDEAFHDCAMLKSVTLPDSVREIGGRAFARCGSLESITLPAGLREIGEFAFVYCDMLKELAVPEGVEKMGQQAAAHCASLKTITLPETLKEIDNVYYNILEGSSASAVVVRGSYAEEYCKEHGILFTYKEDK